MTADQILAAARAAIGAPFRHQGRSLDGGLDCAGLLIHTLAALGIAVEDQENYGRKPINGQLEAALDGQPSIGRVTGPMQPGDLLLMRFGRDPQHLGICAGDTLIHAWQTVGKVCEHRLDEVWRRRIVRIYRVRGIE